MTVIPISAIRLDGGTQPRATLHADEIEAYAAAMVDGAVFPPVTVFFDGTDYWLGDGYHRVNAVLAVEDDEIEADVRQGTRRDAVLFSVGANAAHGLRRTNEDKRRAVLTLLNDPEWSKWSDREVARRCQVNHEMVGKLRSPLSGGNRQIEESVSPTTRTVQRNGTTYEQQVDGINRDRRTVEAPTPVPPAVPWDSAGTDHAFDRDEDEPLPPGMLSLPEKRALGAAPGAEASLPAPAPEPAALPEPNSPPSFDTEAAELRDRVTTALRVLINLPDPDAVWAAFEKSTAYGLEPIQVHGAAGWLEEFAEIYAEQEPRRAARVAAIVKGGEA